jgi:hypothetical protein
VEQHGHQALTAGGEQGQGSDLRRERDPGMAEEAMPDQAGEGEVQVGQRAINHQNREGGWRAEVAEFFHRMGKPVDSHEPQDKLEEPAAPEYGPRADCATPRAP